MKKLLKKIKALIAIVLVIPGFILTSIGFLILDEEMFDEYGEAINTIIENKLKEKENDRG